jgi:hypothetical protein
MKTCFISINPRWFSFLKKANPHRYFALAVSRLGNVARPRWCYTNELVNASIASTDNVSPNGNPANFAIMSTFKPIWELLAYDGEFGQVACEAYN